jgi:tyrosyl-tRNA synthetase
MSDLGLSTLMSGCEHVFSEAELKRKLEKAHAARRPLRVKLGMDPTSPDIHIGHGVALGKLRQFQDLGHRAVLIIGDFTARIGDPTGRSETRRMLSEDEIRANAETYLAQAGRILDCDAAKFETRWNSEWLGGMNFADVLRLTAKITLGQLLKREDFRKRYDAEQAIGLHELLYPLVQGWDSVNIRADVELGGTDQMYNNLVGRDLQMTEGQEPQVVMLMPLLRGLDGTRKMSKSYGNHIALTDAPLDVFGKTMSVPDDLLAEWYRLATSVDAAAAQALIAAAPMEAKKQLGQRIGERLHSVEAMAAARREWEAAFSVKASEPIDVAVPAAELTDGAIAAWKLAWLAHEREISRSDARRMIEGNAFDYADERIVEANRMIRVADGDIFRAGRFRKGDRVKQALYGRVRLGP